MSRQDSLYNLGRSAATQRTPNQTNLIAHILTHRAAILRQLNKFAPTSDCEDLLQTTLIRIMCTNIDEILNPYGYVLQIAWRLWWEDKKLEKAALEGFLRYRNTLDHFPDNCTLLEFEENYLALANALNSLSPRCRKIFEMHRVEQYTYQEIAARIGISESMVKKYLHQATKKLSQSPNEYIQNHLPAA